jgi:hypothetical protein
VSTYPRVDALLEQVHADLAEHIRLEDVQLEC